MELGRVSIFIFCCVFSIVAAEEDDYQGDEKVCFGAFGCFSLEEPWKSLLRPLPAPMSPQKVGTRIYFYSRAQPNKRYDILLRPQIRQNGSPFDRTKPTVFIIHGFLNHGNDPWMLDMKDAYLSSVDANVMLVDWGQGAFQLNYFQVASNTRTVGRELALLIKKFNINPKKIHLVGHSLGAQISAYVGKAIPGTARITALDPAQPGFEGFDSLVRLNKGDAEFIDVIHTDARPLIPLLGVGMIHPVGDVDFYPNGGIAQPGCPMPDLSNTPKITSLLDLAEIPVDVIGKIVACTHRRAFEYYTEALSNRSDCVFWGHRVSETTLLNSITHTVMQGWATKLTATPPDCSPEDCTPMGLGAINSGLRGIFEVTTNGLAPYCISKPGVSLKGDEWQPSELRNDPVINRFTKLIGW